MNQTSLPELSILLIEDENSLLDVMGDEFSKAGFRVLKASNGVEGIKLAKEEHPSVVLLDLVMPEMNGHEVLKQLNETEWGAKIPVIVATNSNSTDDVNKCLEAGVHDYFIKSDVSLQKLVGHVKKKVGAE